MIRWHLRIPYIVLILISAEFSSNKRSLRFFWAKNFLHFHGEIWIYKLSNKTFYETCFEWQMNLEDSSVQDIRRVRCIPFLAFKRPSIYLDLTVIQVLTDSRDLFVEKYWLADFQSLSGAPRQTLQHPWPASGIPCQASPIKYIEISGRGTL